MRANLRENLDFRVEKVYHTIEGGRKVRPTSPAGEDQKIGGEK